MTNKPVSFWIMAAVGVVAGAALLSALLDFAHAMLAHAGPMGLIRSTTLHHKIGELLIAVPLFLTALTRPIWPAERIVANLKAAWPMSGLGAALNLLAWFGSPAPWTDFSRMWPALLVGVGVAAPPLLVRLLTPRSDAA